MLLSLLLIHLKLVVVAVINQVVVPAERIVYDIDFNIDNLLVYPI